MNENNKKGTKKFLITEILYSVVNNFVWNASQKKTVVFPNIFKHCKLSNCVLNNKTNKISKQNCCSIKSVNVTPINFIPNPVIYSFIPIRTRARWLVHSLWKQRTYRNWYLFSIVKIWQLLKHFTNAEYADMHFTYGLANLQLDVCLRTVIRIA